MNHFDTPFPSYVIPGESITATYKGFTIDANIEHDHDYHIDDDDCHNTDQAVTGCSDEQFAQLIKCRDAWTRDEWFYCGVNLTVYKHGIPLGGASLWGIEANYPDSDNHYLTEIANELLDESISEATRKLDDLCPRKTETLAEHIMRTIRALIAPAT